MPTILPLLLLLLTSLPPFAAGDPPGLDAFLAADYLVDPLSVEDPFPSLPSAIISSLTTSPPPTRLLSLRLSVPLHLHLVGPFSPSAPSLLLSFASAALSSANFHSISSSSATSHRLAVSHSLSLHPSLSPLDSNLLSAAILPHVASPPSSLHPSALVPVPFSAVDRIIHTDYLAASAAAGGGGIHVYLLNLAPQSKPYAYSSDDLSGAACLGSIWTSGDRYLWIDLAAGPVHYGPAHYGDGIASLPHSTRPDRALLADLAAVLLSAYQSLLVPPLRLPVLFEPTLIVKFIHIVAPGDRDAAGLSLDTIQASIKAGNLEFAHQPLEFESYTINFADCDVCSFAIARAASSLTTRFLFENYTLIVSEYLDSKLLHRQLTHSEEPLRRLAGMKPVDELFSGKILPVYIFDLDDEKPILLDKHYQAVAFRDMVVAVRTRGTSAVNDFTCNHRHVITKTRELDRPIVAALLQSMWGVAPTHLVWSPEHNSTLADYTWSVGQTPFGPFSTSLSLSFVQRDAARRNVLLTCLNYTITSAIEVLESVTAYGGERRLLKGERRVQFVQRWNLMELKLEKAAAAMSRLDYQGALYFARSSDHDLFALQVVVHKAVEEMEAEMVCFKEAPLPWTWILLGCVVLLTFLYVYVRREKIFRNKRKKF